MLRSTLCAPIPSEPVSGQLHVGGPGSSIIGRLSGGLLFLDDKPPIHSCGGIDVGSGAHYVAVRSDRDPKRCVDLTLSRWTFIVWQTRYGVVE